MPSSDTLQAQKAATAAEVAAATAKLYSQAQETYANDAAESATEASASAQSASDSASLAQQYYSLSLDGVLWFVGSYATAPTERSNGTALEVGDMYKNTTDNLVYSYNSDGTWSTMNSDATTIQELYAAGEELLSQGQALYDQSSEQYDVSVDLYDTTAKIFNPDGFKVVGQVASMAELRSLYPSDDGQEVLVRGYRIGSTIGGGTFYYDESDATTEDNDCTVVVTTSGKRWKRKDVKDVIWLEWAGAQSIDESTDSQDDAFDNAVKAAIEVTSAGGYECKPVVGDFMRRYKLSSQHNIRCGNFNAAQTTGHLTQYRGSGFGIKGNFILDGAGGFTVVQAINTVFDINVDNAGQTLATTPTTDNWILRCEQLVLNPTGRITANAYSGTVLYSKGNTDTSDMSAIWSDLTSANSGIMDMNSFVFNIGKCGRLAYLNGVASGFGHITSVWEQQSDEDSYFNNIADMTIDTLENYVPSSYKGKGRYIFNDCGTLHFGRMLLGAGGNSLSSFNDCTSVTISDYFGVMGSAQGTIDSEDAGGVANCSSFVAIGKAWVINPNGLPFATGKSGQTIIDTLHALYCKRIGVISNDSTYFPTYTGSATGTKPRMVINNFYGNRINNKSLVSGSSPTFLIDTTVNGGGLEISHAKMDNFSTGFTDEADKYFIKCLSSTADIVKVNDCDLTMTTYPLYLTNKINIISFRGNNTTGAYIRYADGTLSTLGCNEIATTSPALTVGTAYSYPYLRKARLAFSLAITSVNDVSVSVNGLQVFYAQSVGTYRVPLTLNYGDTLLISGSATVSNIGMMLTF